MIFKKRTLIFIYILFAALWAQPDSLPNVSSSDSVSVDVLQAKPDTSAVDSPLVASSIEDSAPSIPSIAVTDSAPLIPVFLLPSEVEHFCATKAIVDSLPVHLEAQFLADRFPSSGDTSGSMVIQVSAKRKEKEKTCEFLLTANALIPPDTFSTEMRKSFDPKDSISWGKLIQGAPQELARRFLLATRGNLSISCSEEGSVVKMDGVEDSFPCPTQFTNLRRGNYRVTVTNPSGWDPKVDSIGVRPQQTAQLQIQLQRSQAWLDSVERARKQARHDSILQYAQDHPANTLPEFFSRIFTQVPASPQIVAVLPFGVKGTGNLDYNASIMAAEYFIAELSKDPHYQVLDRASMEKIQAALSQDPELAPDTQVAQAGEKAAAQWVLVGTVGFLGDNQIFSAHLVQVETGEVFSAATALVGDKEVREDYLNSVGTRLAPSSAMWRSLLFPGWGQIYAHHTIHGAMWSALAVGATAYTIWAINHYPTQEVKFQMGLTSSATNQRNVAIAMLASVWTVNLIDTWIVAHQENNRVKTSYFSSQVAIAPLIKENSAGLLLAGRF